MSTVTIRDVRKSYGAVEVIRGVSIDMADGEFVILIGPSGCGKSTLLRMIAGLEEISAGEIAIDARVVNDLPAKERDIAMVFQSYALYPHMSVEENMAFSMSLRGAPKAEIRQRVDKAASILGLTDYLERRPKQLSGGQRQRVAMGRAIVRDPKVFLFDEPLSNLDAKLRVQMRTELKALHQRLGTTIVYVTHDQIEAMTMADKIVVMRDGRIEQTGTPLDLYDNPTNLFVAQFIGSPAMNILPGHVAGPVIDIGGGMAVPLPARLSGSVTEGQKLCVGIRPETFAIGPGGLEATIEVLEPTGAETLISARLGEHAVMIVSRDRVAQRPGDRINVTPDPNRLHIFDRDTTLRL